MGPALARCVVVVAGAAILVVETLTTRLVAPYVGLTLESTTAAIGVALLGIAAGARWGGQLADRHPPARVVSVALAVGGLLVLAVRPLVRAFGPVLGGGPVASLLLVAIATLGAVTALAMVTPAVTKARLGDVATAGAVIGSLSAAGTVGSLAGVFLTGYVLVALLPVAAILLLTSAACLLSALLTSPCRAKTTAVVAVVAAAAVVAGAALFTVRGPCSLDSTYYCANVVADPARPSGRTLVLDDLRHSYVDLADPTFLEFAYIQRMADAVDTSFAAGAALDAVHVGGGGATLPRWLAATRVGTRSTVLELDPAVVELGRRELGVGAIPGVSVRLGDARTSLATIPDASVDLVVGDAFGSRSVPWHLATREFVAEVRRVLRPGGVYVLNVIDNDPLGFLRAEVATVAAEFAQVGVVARADQLAAGGGGNAVVVAAADGLDWGDLTARAGRRPERPTVLDPAGAARFAAGSAVLTDDRAPVDQLLNPYTTR